MIAKLPTQDPNQRYLIVSISYSDERLFLLEDGLEFISFLSRSIPYDTEEKAAERFYSFKIIDQHTLNQCQIDRLLGIRNTPDVQITSTAA